MLRRTVALGTRFYSDAKPFNIESFVSRIQDIRSRQAKKPSSGPNKRNKKPGVSATGNRQPKKPRPNKQAGEKQGNTQAKKPSTNNFNAQGRPNGPSTRGNWRSAPDSSRSPNTVAEAAAQQPTVDTISVESALPFYAAADKDEATALERRRTPQRPRKAGAGNRRKPKRAAAKRAPVNRNAKTTTMTPENTEFLSTKEAVELLLNAQKSDNGFIQIDPMGPSTIVPNLAPSGTTYNSRVWSVVQHPTGDIGQLVSSKVNGQYSGLVVKGDSVADSVARALSANQYLSASDKQFLSNAASGKVAPSVIKQGP